MRSEGKLFQTRYLQEKMDKEQHLLLAYFYGAC